MFFVAFSVFLWAAIYISPLFCGSANEKKMLTKPEELDQGTFSQNLSFASFFCFQFLDVASFGTSLFSPSGYIH